MVHSKSLCLCVCVRFLFFAFFVCPFSETSIHRSKRSSILANNFLLPCSSFLPSIFYSLSFVSFPSFSMLVDKILTDLCGWCNHHMLCAFPYRIHIAFSFIYPLCAFQFTIFLFNECWMPQTFSHSLCARYSFVLCLYAVHYFLFMWWWSIGPIYI